MQLDDLRAENYVAPQYRAYSGAGVAIGGDVKGGEGVVERSGGIVVDE